MTDPCQSIDNGTRLQSRTTWKRVALIRAFVGFSGLAVAQVAASDEIAWNKKFHLPDGRMMVTDGALMLDVGLAKPRVLPDMELPAQTGELMGRHMAAEGRDEVELDDLERGEQEGTYEAPNGLPFAAKYVEFLEDAVPNASLRIGGDLEPVVIVDDDGKAVGLVMAKARVKPQ